MTSYLRLLHDLLSQGGKGLVIDLSVLLLSCQNAIGYGTFELHNFVKWAGLQDYPQ